ncbi:MAG: indole-3-glycerol phosphate synthase TrpC [Candidatus Omnitrophota bacterium]|nr:MAG: indole-3-glycerol phosphate synthase TrpC [Candidatus Omnitrophota bacterium]
MILSKIISEKRKEVEKARSLMPEQKLKELVRKLYIKSAFKRNIARPHHINLIAELKKASPHRGIIRGDFNPLKIALTYQANGASALSVLTDERFFEGSLKILKELKGKVTLPLLRKDFIIDEYQIYESLYWGADAILLIAHILTEEELTNFYRIAKDLGMDVLVEVHNEEDVDKALKSGASIIGINNRDLTTFRIDLSTTQRLVRLIPENKIKVSESGIKTYEDVMFLKSLGINAVLIGEVFMEASDIAAKIREVMRY